MARKKTTQAAEKLRVIDGCVLLLCVVVCCCVLLCVVVCCCVLLCVVVVLLLCCCCVVVVLLLCCCCVVVVLLLCCCCVVVVLDAIFSRDVYVNSHWDELAESTGAESPGSELPATPAPPAPVTDTGAPKNLQNQAALMICGIDTATICTTINVQELHLWKLHGLQQFCTTVHEH